MRNRTIKRILFGAGIFNISGVLLFSQMFTNPYPAIYYPAVFSDFGMILTIIWGLAYMASIPVYNSAGMLMIIFAFEKLAFVISWIVFLALNGTILPEIFSKSPVTGMMLSIYGLGDFVFGCFFAWLGLRFYHPAVFLSSHICNLDGFENHKFL